MTKSQIKYQQEIAEWLMEGMDRLWSRPPKYVIRIRMTDQLPLNIRGRATAWAKPPLIQLNQKRWHTFSRIERRETTLHELAHIYTDKRYGRHRPDHGKEWRKSARKVGCSPRAYAKSGR